MTGTGVNEVVLVHTAHVEATGVVVLAVVVVLVILLEEVVLEDALVHSAHE